MIKRKIEKFFQSNHNQLFGLNLLKFIGMFCISLSHYAIILGSKDRQSVTESNSMIFMINSLYAVDLFFLVSGFILGMKIQQLSLKKGTLLIFDRLLRLYPTYWVALIIYITIQLLFPSAGYEQNCMENILFISTLTHNIFNKFGCFEWGWYIAVEIQSLIFLIFILSFVKKDQYRFIVWFLLISSLSYSLWICFEQNYKISYFAMLNKSYYHNYYQKMQFKIPSYLIGFLFGSSKRITRNLTLSFAALFISLISWVHIWKYQNWYSDYIQNIYQAFSRTIFCLGILTLDVIYVKGGKLASYLLQITSKILFSIYLLHYFLFQIFIANEFFDFGIILNFIGYFLIILFIATIFHILIEQPLNEYLNQIRKKFIGKK